MNLSYAKLRKVLSVFLKNTVLRNFLSEIISEKELEINELGFLDLLEKSKADIEVLEILTEKPADQISPEEAFETFSIFFCSMKVIWKKLRPLLEGLGLRVQTEIQKT